MKFILKSLLVILIILFNAYSQVIIKERIEIEPKIPKKPHDIKSAMSGNNTIKITFINEDTTTAEEIKMQLVDCFDGIVHETSSSNTVSYTYNETNASKFDYIIYCKDPIYGKIYVYLNNNLIKEMDPNFGPSYDVDTGELFFTCWGKIILPVLSTFNFNINGFNACYPLGITGITDCNITQNTSINISEFSLNILEGSEYIGFFNMETGHITENALSCPYQELNQWHYIPLKKNYDPVPISIITSWNEISQTSSFTLKAITLKAEISTGLGIRNMLSPSDEYFLDISASNPKGLNGTSCIHRIDDEDKINIETLSDIEYATFYDYGSEQRGTDLLNLNHADGALDIRVYMDGPIPTETDTLTIKVSCTDSNLTDVILQKVVLPPGYVFNDIPETIEPGDSVKLEIFYPVDDDSLDPFSEDQKYLTKIYKGSEYGRIYSEAEEADVDENTLVPGPLYFIANENIKDSLAIVRIRMEPVDELLPCSVKPDSGITLNENDNLNSSIKTSGNNKLTIPGVKSTVASVSAADRDYWPWFGAIELQILRQDSLDHFLATVEPDTIEPGQTAKLTVIAQNKDNVEFSLDPNTLISLSVDSIQYGGFILSSGDTIASPLDSVKYDDLRNRNISFYVNKDSKIRNDSMTVTITTKKMDEQAIRGAVKLVITNKEHKLKIIQPIIPQNDYSIHYIDEEAKMPVINCQARFSGDFGWEQPKVKWQCRVEYDYTSAKKDPKRHQAFLDYDGGEIGFGSNKISEWNLDFLEHNDIIGGKVTIKASAEIDLIPYSDEITVYIRGKNPDKEEIIKDLDKGQHAMIKTESINYSQFYKETYAKPNQYLPLCSDADQHGWGLCQLDDRYHTITTGRLWDWRENKKYGVNLYTTERGDAEARLERDGNFDIPYPNQTKQSMIDIEAYARYNGGKYARYWEWIYYEDDAIDEKGNILVDHWEIKVSHLEKKIDENGNVILNNGKPVWVRKEVTNSHWLKKNIPHYEEKYNNIN